MRSLMIAIPCIWFALSIAAFSGDSLKLKNNLVKVYSADKFYGSGVIINNRYALTAEHVCVFPDIKIHTQRKKVYTAKNVITPKKFFGDVCLLEFENIEGAEHLKLAEVSIDDEVIYYGYPYGRYKVAKGKIVAELEESGNKHKYYGYEVDQSTAGGGSGGPVFNLEGKLVGIVTMYNYDVDRNMFFIQSRYILRLLKENNVELQ